MKKKSLRALLCAAVFAAVLCFGACGSKDSKTATENQPQTEASTEAATTEAATTEEATTEAAASGKLYASMEEYVASDEVQSQLDSLISSMGSSGMNIEIIGEGNKLIYRYTYTDIENTEGMAESLESTLDTQGATFAQVAESLEAAVDIDEAIIVVEYVDAKGELICSKEFTKDSVNSEEGVQVTGFETMEEYAASSVIQDQLAQQQAVCAENDMECAITGEDNKLIYTFKLLGMENSEDLAAQIESMMDEQAGTFRSIAGMLPAAVAVENPVVVVEYLDMNDELIYSGEYAAE